MVSVVADTPEIEQCLRRLLRLCMAAGAEFSDDLIIECIDGNLALAAPPESAGKILMQLPWGCLAPVEPFRIAVAEDKFVISSHEPALTGTCVAIMEAMLELYNLTHKLAAHRRTSPWALAGCHPELLPPLTDQRNRYFFKLYERLIDSGNKDELDLRSFLHSRVFGYGDATRAPPFLVLMPILDAMNHHPRGAPFGLSKPGDQGSVLTIRRSSPVPGTGNGCFACYHVHDAFDLWVIYGFIDQNVRFVHSVSMTIDLPGLPKIAVTEVVAPRDQRALPPAVADLGFFLPRILTRPQGQVAIGALAIPGPQAPRALRRTLRFLIGEIDPARRHLHDLVWQAERQIVDANTAYYQRLESCLHGIQLKEPLHQPILDNFIRMCNWQLACLREYADFARD